MSDFFNWDNKFMTAMSKASDAILLGILWIACCLPIVTVGASSAAFYYAYHKAVRQRRGYAWKEFFSAPLNQTLNLLSSFGLLFWACIL